MNNSRETFLYERKVNKNADFNMWFVFPGPESFALSSLGYMWLFKELDQKDFVNVERIYSDSKTTSIMRDDVDLIAFSLSFDMNFLQVLEFMDKNGYEFKASKRKESDPLFFAGGPVITSNPEPYKKIFDFMIIGDGEDVNFEVVKTCAQNKNLSKAERLELLSKIDGVYVPSISQQKVKKVTKNLCQCIFTPVISENSFFKNTFILEVERGCANRCAFCLASYMNLPIRFVPYETIIDTIEYGLKFTNKIALLGAQITAHPDFEKICAFMDKKIKQNPQIEMGISSLRVDSFKPDIVQTLVDGGQKNLTLAIEAGSERLRRVINKNLTEEQIFNAVKVAKDCGLKGIKFYGMLGLPTETLEDVDEIINLAKKIKAQFKGFEISFGFSTFVPKANTPFQWLGREDNKTLEKKSNYLQKQMRKIGVQVAVSSPKWDYWQAVMSRGDEKLTDFMIETYKFGGKLGAFKKAAKDLKIDSDYYALENYSTQNRLPWDFIDCKPGKDFLRTEYKRLLG